LIDPASNRNIQNLLDIHELHIPLEASQAFRNKLLGHELSSEHLWKAHDLAQCLAGDQTTTST
jgi:hypothetical protein